MFLPTRPRGARPDAVIDNLAIAAVSIHAPAWGATEPETTVMRPTSCFYPRARVGRDHSAQSRQALRLQFLSTRPRGARPRRDGGTTWKLEFLSTRPRGARQATRRPSGPPPSFLSTRPRGARRQRVNRHAPAGTVSIHAPAWGATCGRWMEGQTVPVSIHAPAWGATSRSSSSCWAVKFLSTRPRGARQAHAENHRGGR